MKNYTIAFLVLFMSLNINAQTTLVVYERVPNVEYQLRNEKKPQVRERVSKMLLKNIKKFDLKHSNGSSIFKESKDNLGSGINNTVEVKSNYKNLNNMTYLSEANFFESYLIKDNLIKYDWEILDDVKVILGYNCKKAVTKIDNETIAIWFTNELKLSDGPAEFWINDGLILELSLNNFKYKATKVSDNPKSTKIDIPSKGKEITKSKFDKKLKDYIESITKMQKQ